MNFTYKTLFTIKNRKAMLLCGFILVGLSSVLLWEKESLAETGNAASGQESASKNQDLINQKMVEIKRIQSDITKYQADAKERRRKGESLENEIALYDSNIQQNQLEIEETKANIEKTELEIKDTEDKIAEDEKNIEKNRAALKKFIQELYDYQQDSVLEILMSKKNLSDFFNEVSSVESTQDKIFQTVVGVKREKEELSARSKELETSQEDYQNLIDVRSEQNGSLESLKAQKNEILQITNGEEDKFQSMVVQNQTLLPSLRAELRDLQSLGSSIKFDDAKSAAKYVGSVTGVRPALLLGILRVESGLGTNVGGGTYLVDMNPLQRPTFEAITAELGYDPHAMPVSRKPSAYTGWGGAMGPAQMMPTTWLIYRNEVAQIVKKSAPDPWNLTDSIAAIAAKLSKVDGVTSGNYDAEYKAAGMYLAGSNWQKFTFYPDKVMYYANLYEKELNS